MKDGSIVRSICVGPPSSAEGTREILGAILPGFGD